MAFALCHSLPPSLGLAPGAGGYKRPNQGAKVTVSYVGRLADGTVFDERPVEDPLTFTTDEGGFRV